MAKKVYIVGVTRLILDTLEKMSTPVRDAQKIPLIGRAEKRRQVMSELECSLVQAGPGTPSIKRRRPNLGGSSTTLSSEGRTLLNGPPVRTLVSPVATTPRPRAAMKSARISTLSFSNAKAPTSTVTTSATTQPVQTSTAVVADSLDTQIKPSTESAPEKSKFQFPFSVPALSGGIGNSQNQKSDGHATKPLIFGADFGKSGGKVRTKLGEKSVDLTSVEHHQEPLPAHLSNPVSSGLEVKQLPNFGFFQKSSSPSISTTTLKTSTDPSPLLNSLSASSSDTSIGGISKSSSKTADTVLMSPVKEFDSLSSSGSILTKSLTYKFSEPVSVSQSPVEIASVVAVNGDIKHYNFSVPLEVSPSVVVANQFAMPDLTSSVTFNSVSSLNSGGIKPAQSLKTGSVMDILGG